MYFQTLDDKAECVGIYANERLIFDADNFPSGIKNTWSYSPYLRGLDVEYASLYLEGQDVWDHIPEYLKDDWEDVNKRLVSFRRSLALSKVSRTENCFFDLVPERFLVDYCEVKNKITKHIFTTINKPKRYDFYKHVSMMLGDIQSREISIDRRLVTSLKKNPKLKNQAENILTCDPCVKYKQFGTKTGRLSTHKNTFPILTLNRSFRRAILPTNDFFVEIDFNGAEIRTLLGLLGEEQPMIDVHDFHVEEIFDGHNRREAVKTAFFAWLYGSKSAIDATTASRLASFYDKETILRKYWTDGNIITPYGKTIKDVDKHHALNYLVQSTAAELTLKQALKIDYLLRNRSIGSHVCFLIHDAVILDMKNEDKHLIKDAVSLMGSTNFGNFLVNTSSGDTLGSMMEMA